jgi:hypothetical protein
VNDELAHLLERATVRIDVDGAVAGTGFLVGPGKVLTCYHVVKRALLRPGGHEIIDVVDPRTGTSQHPLAPPRYDAQNDLALLSIEAKGRQSAVVVLGDVPRIGDRLFAYGYPPVKPGGTPGTYDYEGTEGGPPRLLKMKVGQVREGLSGSPLLDLRTGTVIGIVRKSRGVDSDIGGLAVPIDVAFAVFERLKVDNLDAARIDGRWRRSMTEEQRAGLDEQAPAAGPARDLLVVIGQSDERWTVSLTSASPDEDWGAEVRIDLNVLRPDVARLFRMLKATDPTRLNKAQQSLVVGQALAKTLWSDDVQQRLRGLLGADDTVLDLLLHFRDDVDEDLLYLPWETLYLPDDPASSGVPVLAAGVRFASDDAATLVRILRVEPVQAFAAPEPLHVVVFRSPGESPEQRQALAAEADEIGNLAKQAGETTVVPTSATEGDHPTESVLRDLLGTGPTVLHYVARARYQSLDDERGKVDAVDIDDYPADPFVSLGSVEFAQIFTEHVPPPALVILQPVRVSDTELPPDLTVFARALLERGVRAVLAFPLPVDSAAAHDFFEVFYREIGAGQPVHTAVQRGRSRLEKARRPWAFPVLVAQAPGPITLTRRDDPESTGKAGP